MQQSAGTAINKRPSGQQNQYIIGGRGPTLHDVFMQISNKLVVLEQYRLATLQVSDCYDSRPSIPVTALSLLYLAW